MAKNTAVKSFNITGSIVVTILPMYVRRNIQNNDTQHNNVQCNNTQHKGLFATVGINDTQHNNATIMLSVEL
jgi:hypothetical protein